MTGNSLTLALDQGTHSTRAVVFDAHGNPVALARHPVALQRHSRTQVEQSPAEILASLHAAMEDVFGEPGVDPARIAAVGLATQRSSVLAWERTTGNALSPVLSWQDTRTADQLAALAAHAADIQQRTGLRLSPHYGAGKIRWLLDNNADVAAACRHGSLVIGPLASYLLHHLLAGHTNQVDHANASRTLLWNLQTGDWDNTLLGLFDIPREVLPDCRPITAPYGNTLNGNIPVTAVNGDQTAALYAQGTPDAHVVRVNMGTGAFVLLPTGERCHLHAPLLSGLSHSNNTAGEYYLEGTINGAGAAVHWLEQRCELAGWQEQLPAWLETIQSPPVFLNSIGGLGSPWWRPGPEPDFLSAAGSVSPAAAEALVAVIESILFLVQANLELLCALDPGIRRIRISGGLAQADGLCQKLANLSGMTVERGTDIEATARGIAWLAAGQPEEWKRTDETREFLPRHDAALGKRYARFLEALQANGQK
jgi:glycerol kinase